MRWFVALATLLLLFSCKKGDVAPILFYHEGYYEVFPEKAERYDQIKDELSSRHGKPLEVELQNFETFPEEAARVLGEQGRGVLFLEYFMLPPFLNNRGEISLEGSRVVTYGDRPVEAGSESLKLFNITYRQEQFYEELLKRCRESGAAEDLSNCLIVYNSSHMDSVGFRQYASLSSDYKGKEFDLSNLDFERLKGLFEDDKSEVVVLFGGRNNELINESDAEKVEHKVVIEVFTNYGNAIELIDYRFVPDYELMLNEGFASEEYEAFWGEERAEVVADATGDETAEAVESTADLNGVLPVEEPLKPVEPVNYIVESEGLFLFEEMETVEKFKK